jgi:hypothetical protein
MYQPAQSETSASARRRRIRRRNSPDSPQELDFALLSSSVVREFGVRRGCEPHPALAWLLANISFI